MDVLFSYSMENYAKMNGLAYEDIKESLYSHFSSKDQLLGQIFEYPMAALTNIGPQGADAEQMIVSLGADGFMTMATGVFNRWISTPEMEKVWRVICIELYHNEPMRKFYEKFTGETIAFWRSNFSIMMKHKLIKRSDPDVLAQEYLSLYLYAFMDYFIINYGTAGSFLEAEGKRLDDHMTFLVKSIKA